MSTAPQLAKSLPPTQRGDAAGRTPRHMWDYWRIFWEGRRILRNTLVACVAVAVIGTLLMPNRYRAETLLEINLAQTAVLGSKSDIERQGGRGYFEEDKQFRTEFVKIKTDNLMRQAIEKHGLLEKVPDLARLKEPAQYLLRVVEVDRLTQTNVAKLGVSWEDPEQAAILANAVAQTYVDFDLEQRRMDLRARKEALIGSLGEKNAARRSVVERELGIIKTNPPLDTILGLSTMKERDTLQKLWEDLHDAERDLSSTQASYGPASLEVQEKVAARNRVRQQVDDARTAAIEDLKRELVALGGDPEQVEPKFNLSKDEDESNADFMEKLRIIYNENELLLQTAESKAHVIEPARPPRKPYSPRLWLNVSLAIIVGLGFGGGFVLFRDYLDVSVKTLDDVEQDLGLNLLAVMPKHDVNAPDRVIKEAYQTLRTGLLFASGGRKHRILLVTSGAPQEGKSSLTANLARSMAAAGESVILVDCDLRRAGASRFLGVKKTQGLSSWLADAANHPWRELVVQVEPKLAVLPTGPVPPNPVDLLGLERFRGLLGELRASYDWVILDSPPVSAVTDSVLLGSVAEMVMVVMRHDQTDKEVIRRALQRLRNVGSNIVGAVLNDVDMSKSYNRDYYYGRFYYGSYYGEEGAAGKGTKPKPWIIRKLLKK